MDGQRLDGTSIPLVDDGVEHAVTVRMGHAPELNGSSNGVAKISEVKALGE